MENQYMEKQAVDYDANPFAIDDTFQNDIPPSVHLYEPSQNKFRWHHIEDLDTFFTRIYNYHQKNGFLCMMVEEMFEPLQFLFIILLTFFLLHCINYSQLFRTPKWISHNTTQSSNYQSLFSNGNSPPQNIHERISLWDALEPISVCTQKHYKKTHPFLIVCLLLASIFLFMRIFRIFQHLFQYWEIRSFYINALKINTDELPNTTWQDIQTELKRVQREQRLCIHKAELSDLDIHHRILRFQNYMVAFVNKDLFPLNINIPFVGEVFLVSQALQYNLEMILFWGPWSPFKSNWQLKEEYKKSGQRLVVAKKLSRHILWVAIVNLLLSPVILIWQILYFFFNYGQLIKNEPGALLGTRRWSPYARLYFRHYNEPEHQLRARLARAYPHARKYMASFVSPLAVILVKNVCFFTGSVLAVIVLLTLIDEDVLLSTEYVLTFATILGVIYGACRTLVIPWDEPEVPCCRQTLMDRILAHAHYLPADWLRPGAVSRPGVRDAFAARFFELRLVHFLRETLSALAVPYVLLAGVRPRALDVVDFLRNFTVEVEGVGDVCSFARMEPPADGAGVAMATTGTRDTESHVGSSQSASSVQDPVPTRPRDFGAIGSEEEDERDEILGPLRQARAKRGSARNYSLVRSSRGVADKACSPLPPLDPEPPFFREGPHHPSQLIQFDGPPARPPVLGGSFLRPALPKTALSLINFAVDRGLGTDQLIGIDPAARHYLSGLKQLAESVFCTPTGRHSHPIPREPQTVDGGSALVDLGRVDDDDLTSVMASLVTMSTLGGGYSLVANDLLRNLPAQPPLPEIVNDHVTPPHDQLEEVGPNLTCSIWLPTLSTGVTLSSYPTGATPSALPHVMLHRSLMDLGPARLVVPHTKDSVIPYSVIDMSLTVLYLHNRARQRQIKAGPLPQPKFRRHTSLDNHDQAAPPPLFASLGQSVKFKIFHNNDSTKTEEESCPLLMKSFQPPKYDV